MGVDIARSPTSATPDPRWRQYRAALPAALAALSCGIHFAWSSPALAQVARGDVDFQLSLDEQSWVVMLPQIGAILGAPLGGIVVDAIGRKLAVLTTCVPFTLCWGLVFFSTAAWFLFVARVIAGLGMGLALIVVPMYLAEISSPRLRGELGALTLLAMNLGTVMQYGLGSCLSFRALAVVSSFVPVLCFVTFLPMPETPYFLVMRSRSDEARQTLASLRNEKECPDSVDKELAEITDAVQDDLNNRVTLRKALSCPGNRRALLIVCSLGLMQTCSGMAVYLGYFQFIYEKTASAVPLAAASMVFAVLQMVACLASSLVVDRAGRRPLLIGSGCALFVAQTAMGGFFYLEERLLVDDDAYKWIPLVAMILFVIAFNVGLGPLCFVLVGEMVGPDVKAIGGTLATMCICGGAAASGKLFPLVADAFGTYTAFWGFSAVALLVVAFTAICIPETKGKTLAEIQMVLRGEPVSQYPHKC